MIKSAEEEQRGSFFPLKNKEENDIPVNDKLEIFSIDEGMINFPLNPEQK